MNQGALIRFLVVALPLGLFAIGIGSMIKTQMGGNDDSIDPNEEARLEASSLNRRPVSPEDLAASLRVLTETIGERRLGAGDSLERTALWLESTLGRNIGYVVEREEYEVEGKKVRNLVATLPGSSRQKEIIIVGAHYDTVPECPGANDNGTGVAALVALARAFAGERQERTVRFVAFVNEEPPFFHTELMGSRVYARRCRERGDEIAAAVVLDTIGFFTDEPGSQETPPGLPGDFPDVGNFLAFVGNDASRTLADQARLAFERGSAVPALSGGFPETVPGVAWSDQWSFWQEGYPAIMVTDTAPYRYAHYHQSTDTIDKIDVEKLAEVVAGLESVVRALANP